MVAVVESLRARFRKPAFTLDCERPADVVARETLLDRALGPDRTTKSSELLRRGRIPAEGLALVARDGAGHVVGTVRLWTIEAGIGSDGRPVSALLLGPLAVEPGMGGRGIGTALMKAAIRAARERGHGAIILVGDPGYYGRFGFSGALAEGLIMPGPFERRRLQALELKTGWLTGAAGMISAAGPRLSMPAPARAA